MLLMIVDVVVGYLYVEDDTLLEKRYINTVYVRNKVRYTNLT